MALGHLSFPDIGVLILLLAASCLADTEDASGARVEQRQIRQNPMITCPGLYDQRSQDPADCASYYVCNNNRVTRRGCPTGQVFNPTLRICGIYPTPRGCQTLGLAQNPTQLEHAPTYQCPQSHGNFQDTNDCSSFYVCTNYQARRHQCPDGQMFDPNREACSNINNPVGCQRRQGVSGAAVQCPEMNGRFQDASDCSMYYVCTNWIAQRLACPSGQLFDPTRGSCGNINNPGNCQLPTGWRPSGGSGWAGQITVSFQCTQVSGRFQDTADCSRYYLCTNWNPQRLTCPRGQLFDPTRGSCGNINDPDNCVMPVGWRPSGGSSWTGQTPVTFHCNQVSGRFQDSTDCSRYYLCTNWNPQILTCPRGQLFDPTRGSCGNINNPGNCEMPFGWRPSGGSGWTGQATVTFQCTQVSGRFQDTSDCSRYYVCTNWNAQRLVCPSGQLFDPTSRSCGSINNPGGCRLPAGWRPVTGTGSGWTGQPSDDTYTCQEAHGEFPYPPDCSRFVRCDHFRGVIMGCPGNLLFNPERGYCDWPEHYVAHRSCTLPPGRANQFQNLTSGRYYY